MARVLIVEDEPSCRESLQLLLEIEQHEVLLAADAQAALATAAAQPPDVVILDWHLCDRLTGLDVLEQLRRHQPALQAIVTTGSPSAELEAIVRRTAGAVYMAKPYRPAEMLAAIRSALGQNGGDRR